MKKTISILAAAVLLLTGCADSSSVTDTDQTSTAAQTVTSASESAETTASSESAAVSSSQSENGAVTQTTSAPASQSTVSSSSETAVTSASRTGQSGTPSAVTTVSTSGTVKPPLVTKLSSLAAKGNVYSITDAGNGKVIVTASNSAGVSSAYLVDTAEDRQITSFRLSSSYETPLGVTPANELICQDFNSDSSGDSGNQTVLVYYDLASGQSKKLSYKNTDPTEYVSTVYDRASDTVYGTGYKTVYAYSRDGSFRSYHKTGQKARCCNYFSPVCNISFDSDCVRNDGSGSVVAAFDGVTGNPLYNFAEYNTMLHPTKSRLICREGTYLESKNTTVSNVFIRDLRTGEELNRFKLNEGQTDLYNSEYTDSAMLVTWNEKSWYPSAVIPFDTVSCKRARTGVTLGKNTTDIALCYLKDSSRWAIAVTERNGRSLSSRIFLIDPEQSDYSKSFDKADSSFGTAAPVHRLGKKYEPLHEVTDRIERETGVRVLIGDEVLNADSPSGYRMESMESSDYWTVQEYRKNLLNLEKELTRYPAGFFKKFSSAQRVGVRVLVVDSLVTTTPGSTFTAGGVAYEGSAWYNIAIAAHMMYENDMSIHHEMWHIVEDQLRNSQKEPDFDKWNACNPKKFEYTNDFNSYYDHPEYENYIFSFFDYSSTDNANNIYFARDYSTVNVQEDRATLIELAFGNLSGTRFEGLYRDNLEMMQNYPHLTAKLNVLADAVRKEWGYVYWDEIFKAERAAA